jgi:hypothetical protein
MKVISLCIFLLCSSLSYAQNFYDSVRQELKKKIGLENRKLKEEEIEKGSVKQDFVALESESFLGSDFQDAIELLADELKTYSLFFHFRYYTYWFNDHIWDYGHKKVVKSTKISIIFYDLE